MKQIKFLAVALAALTMFSCSKESIDNVPGKNEPGEKASLTINVTGEGNLKPASRASGATTSDVTVNDYIVFLFRDGGGIDCPPQYSSSNAPMTITAGTTAAKTAYVVANTGVLAGGKFEGVKTLDDLKKVTDNLMDATNNVSTQTATNLWMAGTGTTDIAYGTSGDMKKGAVTVALHFVAAKIQLIVKDNRTNKTGGAISIEDKEVVLLFAGKTGKFFETAPNQAIQTDFYTGDQAYDGHYTGATLSTALSDKVETPFTKNDAGTVFNHFYTFGNNGEKMPTILAIKSIKTIDGVEQSAPIYYPLQFKAEDSGTGIEPGMFYTVTFTLNGDVGNGEGGGTINPENPMVSSEIEVSVTAASWTPKAVDKEFN